RVGGAEVRARRAAAGLRERVEEPLSRGRELAVRDAVVADVHAPRGGARFPDPLVEVREPVAGDQGGPRAEMRAEVADQLAGAPRWRAGQQHRFGPGGGD